MCSWTNFSICILLNIKSTNHLSYVPEPQSKPQSISLKMKVSSKFVCLILSSIGGRILVFASHINGIGAGQLVARDDPKLYNTDKERNMVTPANDHFIKMANECVQ